MQKRYLTESEQARLLDGAQRVNDPLAQRDHHWMCALVLTGMRITEFSLLTVPMVEMALQVGWLVSPPEHCKGREGKKRSNEYMVTAALRVHLEALVKFSQAEAKARTAPAGALPLVWGRDGALSVRSYEDRLKHWVAHAGLDPRISPHWLRHTRGMNIMRRSRGTNPLKVAQIALGHASLKSTGIYLDMSREEFERELQLVDGGRVSKKAARRMALGAGA